MNLKNYPLTRYALWTMSIAILVAVSGCGGAKTLQESVIVRDTVVVTKERVIQDTLVLQKDTTIYQDRVKLEVRYLEGEKVLVRAECPPDTIRIETIKVIQQSIPEKPKMTWEGLLGWVIAILCLLVIVRTIAQKLI